MEKRERFAHRIRLAIMVDVGHNFDTAAVFGASGGIGVALCKALADGGTKVWAGARSGSAPDGANITPFRFDLDNEASIESAAAEMRNTPPDLIIVASGVLTLPDGTGPERSYRKLDPEVMAKILHINAIGPALIAKHFLPLLPKDRRAVFAALSARVGSIGDNGLGGWHSYRMSKTALNMLIKNCAIEMARTHKQAVIAGLHPGTVDSELSQPFQANVPEGQLFSPAQSASKLLDVLAELTSDQTGGVFDYDGAAIPA